MMRIGRTGLLSAMLASAVGAAPLSPKSTDDDVLDAMHDRGGDLKSFSADVVQTQVNLNQGGEVKYTGTVVFQSLPDHDARLHLMLNTKQKGDGKVVRSPHEYLLEKGWLTEREENAKNEVRRQVVRAGQTIDLFSLGKGAFPLPIGQDKAKVHELFDVSRPKHLAEDPPDPPHTIHLRLTPKDGTDLARQFQWIDFCVDVDQRMPVRIETLDSGLNDQTTDLANLKVNPKVSDGAFALPPLPPGWTTEDKPLASARSHVGEVAAARVGDGEDQR